MRIVLLGRGQSATHTDEACASKTRSQPREHLQKNVDPLSPNSAPDMKDLYFAFAPGSKQLLRGTIVFVIGLRRKYLLNSIRNHMSAIRIDEVETQKLIIRRVTVRYYMRRLPETVDQALRHRSKQHTSGFSGGFENGPERVNVVAGDQSAACGNVMREVAIAVVNDVKEIKFLRNPPERQRIFNKAVYEPIHVEQTFAPSCPTEAPGKSRAYRNRLNFVAVIRP
jgi:hypothetical protein